LPVDVIMPKLSLTMQEGSIVKWHKAEGEKVDKGDILLEVMTDKAAMEVEARVSGVLAKILNKAGDKVKVGAIIAIMALPGEDIELIQIDVGKDIVVDQLQPAVEMVKEELEAAVGKQETEDRIKSSPAARRLAVEKGVSLEGINGSGPCGRIIEDDILMMLSSLEEKPSYKVTPLARSVADTEGVDLTKVKGSGPSGKIMRDDVANIVSGKEGAFQETIPLSGMRQVIAERMSQSIYTAPHVTLIREVDVANLLELKDKINKAFNDSVRLSVTVLFMAIAAKVLKNFPQINARFESDCSVIRFVNEINVGIAVSLEEGLVVPVVHNTAEMGLHQLATVSATLIEKARSGKLLPEEMQGGTFTVSSLGGFGVDGFTPIINQPESAILGLGRIINKPVYRNGDIVARPMMHLSLSFDHRIVDGVPAARFLEAITSYLEEPLLLLA